MVIGLLIAGVLKGQELIENARHTQYIRQINAYDTAQLTFRAIYSALPGDIRYPDRRLPNCTAAPCSTSGNNNGRLTEHFIIVASNMRFINTNIIAEPRNFWVHLYAAGLITGIDPSIPNATPFSNQMGKEVPAGPIPGTGVVVDFYGCQNTLWYGAEHVTPGNYYIIRRAGNNDFALTPAGAFFIDQKLDDGKARTGNIRPVGRAAAGYPEPGTCVTTPSATSDYAINYGQPACNLQIPLSE